MADSGILRPLISVYEVACGPLFCKGLRYFPTIIGLLIVGWMLCRVANLIFHLGFWVHVWLFPFEMVPTFLDYAWARMTARLRTKPGLMFALAGSHSVSHYVITFCL